MVNAICLLYDLSTPKNKKATFNIITTLSSRGIAYDAAENSENMVELIIGGAVYSKEFIEKHWEEVLNQAIKTGRASNKDSELAEIASQP